jgi:hypothetical protein
MSSSIWIVEGRQRVDEDWKPFTRQPLSLSPKLAEASLKHLNRLLTGWELKVSEYTRKENQ